LDVHPRLFPSTSLVALFFLLLMAMPAGANIIDLVFPASQYPGRYAASGGSTNADVEAGLRGLIDPALNAFEANGVEDGSTVTPPATGLGLPDPGLDEDVTNGIEPLACPVVPIPEPASLLLIGVGLLALAITVRLARSH
jgi:hypothetical protein